jgi:DNA-binding LytR/AlgR family response regulator
VNRGDSLIPVSAPEIAFFYAEEKAIFLVTKENKRYIINNTLEELEARINPALFFRVNRQFIIAIDTIQKIHNYFNYKLKLEIVPDPKIEIIVSKNRCTEFKSWMNSEFSDE